MTKHNRKCEICERDAHYHGECIFHSNNSYPSEKFKEEFWKEFEIATEVIKGENVRVLDYRDEDKKRDEKRLDFGRFIFPKEFLEDEESSPFKGIVFKKDVVFDNVIFQGDVSFIETTFTTTALFRWAKFLGEVDFYSAKFSAKVDFIKAEFSEADFRGVEFGAEANFREVKFSARVDFYGAEFSAKANAYFNNAEFSEANFQNVGFFANVRFDGAKFSARVDFIDAKFSAKASFHIVEFSAKANAYFIQANFLEVDFQSVKFKANAYFIKAKFSEANFNWATFSEKVDFSEATFSKGVSFERTRFHNEVTFEGTNNNRIFSNTHITSFQRAKFEKPEKVRFISVNLSRTSFLYSDIKNIQFQDVDWYRKPIISVVVLMFVSVFISFSALFVASHFISFSALFVASPHLLLLALFVGHIVATFLTFLFTLLLGRSATRLALYDEIKETEKQGASINKYLEDRITRYKLISDLYKQLRYNYEKSLRYSEDAGDFYIGEMEMRRLISIKESILDFILLSLYRALSYYGERWWLPLLWSGWVIGLFSFIITILYGSTVACEPFCYGNLITIIDASLLTSILTFLQQSTDINFSKTYPGIAERLISIVLVTMFVLAIRRKFTR